MTLKELIENRHSIRKFKDTPVPDEDVLEIIDAIRRGPSSENEQPWHFVIVRNQDFKDKLAALIKKRQEELFLTKGSLCGNYGGIYLWSDCWSGDL